jgi:hypothetical protein
LDEFKSLLKLEFDTKDGGPVNYFLGFNVYRDREARKLYLSQEHYIESLLERFDMATCNPAKTPLPATFTSSAATDAEHELAKHEPYPAMVGSLLYLATITRPDIAYATSLLSRTVSKWNMAHVRAARHLMRYLRATSELCLTFAPDTCKRVVLGYADADWGGCLDTRRSTTGYLFKIYGGPVAWKSRRQPTTALSTAEAEFMASSDAARQALWIQRLMTDLGFLDSSDRSIPILNDNNAAIQLSKDPVNHDRSKHIDIRTHFIREKVNNGDIDLSHVPTKENLADGLTKPLPADRHSSLFKDVGLEQRAG